MPPRSDPFALLLKAGIASIAALEGKTAPVIEDDLGAQIGVSGFQIQRYKAGTIPPAPRSVAILAEACVRRGLLGKAWLEQLLRAAQHPAPERVVAAVPRRPGPAARSARRAQSAAVDLWSFRDAHRRLRRHP